jgi:hypothetical protein
MSQGNPFGPSRKGVTDMRTRSGTSRQSGQQPYKAHLRLVALEMQRFRLETERRGLLDRAARCAERLAILEAEAKTLMAVLGYEGASERPAGEQERKKTSITSYKY